ncbi:hypothetical protein AGOR_G00207170 [Albula goreensis]|uniref:Uncharacterized protein n=1 Tax=Albula goreensis TaxID=1534307 RepID=A0A8T3CSV2_9TELE|nr:hypothetical protein AGOR_G00207170 [Albula goreensis]
MQISTWFDVVIGHDQRRYVNEHLVAFASLAGSGGFRAGLSCAQLEQEETLANRILRVDKGALRSCRCLRYVCSEKSVT